MAENRPESIIDGIVDFFTGCPLLKDGAFRVDALGDTPMEYTIEIDAFDPVIQEYVDGSKNCRYQFAFGSREYYDLDRMQNIANSMFYEQLSRWVSDKSARGELPAMPVNCYPDKLRAMSSGFVLDENGTTARYRVQFELTYLERKPRRTAPKN